MMFDTDEDARAAALEFAQGIAAFWEDRLGAGLLGVYLLGSLAHGGFNRRYSDIDIGLVADTPLDDGMLDAMRADATARAPELAPKLSLFWADRNFSAGRFPPLDRIDYLDNAVALVEQERVQPARPALEDVRRYLRGAPFETWSTNASRLAGLGVLEPEDYKPYLRAHLYPARFVYSWATGRMASNDDAVAYLYENRPLGLDVDLIARALQCRHDAADPDGLFPDRAALPRQVDACARFVAI